MSDMQSLNTNALPDTRHFGAVNWMGLRTLYMKEVRRFLKVGPQTLLAPVISNLLYMTVFVLAFSALRPDPKAFMAFKMMGSITDILMPPLSYFELALGWIGGAATRGVLVATVTALALSFFAPMVPVKLWAVLFFGISAALMMGMVGVLSGIWAEKFDQLAVVNQFIILPLSFLSGTFYSIDVLPATFQKLILFNPLFYLIDGFRYGFLGTSDGPVMTGVIVTTLLNLILFIAVLKVLKSGWRIKS